MASVSRKLAAARNEPVIRLQGCPVSVAEQLFALVVLGKAKNPYLEPSEAFAFNQAYMGWRAATAMKRLMGERYQKAGACSRGEAMPNVTPVGPPPDVPAIQGGGVCGGDGAPVLAQLPARE
jgi:hypothetical protein